MSNFSALDLLVDREAEVRSLTVAALDEWDAGERDWIIWWTSGHKGNFVWPREAHERLRAALHAGVPAAPQWPEDETAVEALAVALFYRYGSVENGLYRTHAAWLNDARAILTALHAAPTEEWT